MLGRRYHPWYRLSWWEKAWCAFHGKGVTSALPFVPAPQPSLPIPPPSGATSALPLVPAPQPSHSETATKTQMHGNPGMQKSWRSLRGSKPVLCKLQLRTQCIISLSCLLVTVPGDVNDIIKSPACHVPLHPCVSDRSRKQQRKAECKLTLFLPKGHPNCSNTAATTILETSMLYHVTCQAIRPSMSATGNITEVVRNSTCVSKQMLGRRFSVSEHMCKFLAVSTNAHASMLIGTHCPPYHLIRQFNLGLCNHPSQLPIRNVGA